MGWTRQLCFSCLHGREIFSRAGFKKRAQDMPSKLLEFYDASTRLPSSPTSILPKRPRGPGATGSANLTPVSTATKQGRGLATEAEEEYLRAFFHALQNLGEPAVSSKSVSDAVMALAQLGLPDATNRTRHSLIISCVHVLQTAMDKKNGQEALRQLKTLLEPAHEYTQQMAPALKQPKTKFDRSGPL